MELEVDSKPPKSNDVNGGIRKFRWRIENFSSIEDERERLYSDIFIVDGIEWKILLLPKGSHEDNYLSIYLVPANSKTLPLGWSTFAQFGFAVINQIDRKTSSIRVNGHETKVERLGRGFLKFLALSGLHNPERGFLVDDECLIEAYVSCDRSRGFISNELILESVLGKHKIKEADRAKAATKPVETTTVSPTQPPCTNVAIEPEDPVRDREEMNTFFTSLEHELLSSNFVFSQEYAREAVAKLDEALNKTPVDLYNSGKFSSLKHAFKTLASFDCSSAILTVEQKNELFSMEDILKQLIDRAAKALQDKNEFTAKESMKMTTTHNLDRNLRRYKEVESEVKHLLAEQNEIFKSSKKMKLELETIRKECVECEANAKVAEEDEKTVEAEWRRIKQFISSLKGKF